METPTLLRDEAEILDHKRGCAYRVGSTDWMSVGGSTPFPEPESIRMFEPNDVLKELQNLEDNGFLSDTLLRRAVKDIAVADDRFDWVGVYLVNSEEGVVWLHNYVGKPTPHSKIPVGEGICGTAVAEGKNSNVPDVSAVDNYIVRDPRVKSEMVVLIRGDDEIFGLIDIDSRTVEAFTNEDSAAVQVVTDKLAEQLAQERS